MSSHSQNNSDDSSESQPTAGTETVPSGANQDAPSYSHVLAQEELATLEPDDCRTHGANALIEDDDVGTGNEDRRSEETSSGHVYVGSLEVEDYWILIRRFNKQVFHVKKTKTRPRGDLDMHIAADEDITSEKLQAHAERLYMVVITRLLTSYKQLVRLRSWKERPRTLCFLGAYTIAWLADLLLPAMVLFVIILIAYPSARATCFPAAPASLTNYATGAVQKPFAGVLASDSVTGAPEKHRGEAVEQEASSFFTSIGTVSSSFQRSWFIFWSKAVAHYLNHTDLDYLSCSWASAQGNTPRRNRVKSWRAQSVWRETWPTSAMCRAKTARIRTMIGRKSQSRVLWIASRHALCFMCFLILSTRLNA